jgi:hypothetical protein
MHEVLNEEAVEPLAMRRVAAVIAAVAVTATAFGIARAQTPAQDAKAAALLAKHRAYVGWQFGDGSFTSMRISGHLADADGKTEQTFVLLSGGLVYHNTYTLPKLGDLTTHTGFTGNLFWHSDVNGFTTPVYGDYAKYLASFTLLLQEGTTELPATFVENTTVDDKMVAVVRVTLKNGDAIDCDVDPDTGAYVAATIDPDGAYERTIHILSYRELVPGKRMMSSYRIGRSKTIATFEKFEPNVPVSNEDLHPPAATASWTFGSGTPFPIALTRSRMLIDASVNGVKGRFILDTGSSAIVLDDQFADRANVPVLHGGDNASTLYGSVKTRARRAASMAFGDSTLHNVAVYTEDFRNSDYRGLDRQGYDGLVGFDLFAAAIVKLDVYAAKMTLLDPSTDLSSIHGLPLLVDLSDQIPEIPMTLNKTVSVNAALDTGSPGIVFVDLEFAKRHHLSFWTRGCGNIESLSIGPIVYTDQAVCAWGLPAGDMLVGFDFLKHFDYVFDYPHGRMFMTPNKN